MKKYWRILIRVFIFLIGVLFLFFPKGEHQIDEFQVFLKSEEITSYSTGNILGNGEEYLVGLNDGEVVIYILGGVITEVYRKDYSHLQPWKIAIGDIDGDGIDDISIGVYKESPLHPVMAKRPFIYNFIQGNLEPKWRGSRLSRPFEDYNFYDVDYDGIDEIIAIEILEDNRNVINTYKWKGFGFEGFIESKDYDELSNLIINDEKVYINIKEGKDKYIGRLKLEEGNLIIERMD